LHLVWIGSCKYWRVSARAHVQWVFLLLFGGCLRSICDSVQNVIAMWRNVNRSVSSLNMKFCGLSWCVWCSCWCCIYCGFCVLSSLAVMFLLDVQHFYFPYPVDISSRGHLWMTPTECAKKSWSSLKHYSNDNFCSRNILKTLM